MKLEGTPEEIMEFLNKFHSKDEITTNGRSNNPGMGRYYSETIDDSTQIVDLPDFNSLSDLFKMVTNKISGNIVKSEIIDNLPELPGINKDNFQYDPEIDTGYFGWVSSEYFVGYEELCKVLHFTKGTLMPDDMGWLVFYYHGELLYIPQHPIRYNVSWSDIDDADLVYGNQTILFDNYEYSISLLTGGKSDPVLDKEYWKTENSNKEIKFDIGHGSMWNELIYRVHQDIPGVTDKNELNSGGPQHGNNWDELSDEDLNINIAKCKQGSVTWCQETSSVDSSHRISRGHYRLAYLCRRTASSTNTFRGWRPVLRYTLKKDM